MNLVVFDTHKSYLQSDNLIPDLIHRSGLFFHIPDPMFPAKSVILMIFFPWCLKIHYINIYIAVLCCAVLCCAVLCCAVPSCAVLCYAVLCCSVLCWAALEHCYLQYFHTEVSPRTAICGTCTHSRVQVLQIAVLQWCRTQKSCL